MNSASDVRTLKSASSRVPGSVQKLASPDGERRVLSVPYLFKVGIRPIPPLTLSIALLSGASSLAASQPDHHRVAEKASVLHSLSIPAQPLSEALKILSAAADEQLLYSDQFVASKRSANVEGTFTTEEALKRLLMGTGLKADRTPSGVLLIRAQEIQDPDTKNEGVNSMQTRSKLRQGAALLGTGVVGLSAVLGPQGGHAQEPQQNVSGAVEEVLVTARRREESLQDVPLAISAMGGGELAERGVQRVENMNAVIPNLSVNGGQGNGGESQASFRVRGMPGVSVYIDGVNQPTTDGLLTMSVVEVDRIEVLRGPQGTLFGNTSLGGAVHYVTRAPADVFGARIEASLGSYGRRDAQAAFDVPLSDTFKTKFTVSSQFREGYLHSKASTQDFGDINDELYRADFLWTPTNNLRFRYNAEQSTTDRVGAARIIAEMDEQAIYNVNGRQIAFIPVANAYQSMGIDYSPRTVVSGYPGGMLGKYDSNLAFGKRGFVVDQMRHTLDATWDINDTFTVRSITGYKELMRFTETDQDGITAIAANRETGTKNYSLGQELQLLGSHERVDWVLGAYYQEEYNRVRTSTRSLPEFTCDLWGAVKANRRITFADEISCYNNRARALGVTDASRQASSATTPAQLVSLANQLATQFSVTQPTFNGLDITPFINAVSQSADSLAVTRPEARAVFGDITFRLTDQWTVAAGLRYSEDDTNGTLTLGGIGANRNLLANHHGLTFAADLPNFFGFVGPLPAPTNAQKSNALTKRLTVQYQWNPDLMTYVGYADGYQPGGTALLTQVAPAWLALNAAGVATGGALRDIYNGLIPGATMDASVSIVRDEESVRNFEVGLRADWFGGALRTNVTAFFTTWENFQATENIATKYWDTDGNGFFDSELDITGDGVNDLNRFIGGLTVAVAKAEMKGLEIESTWRATEQMRVNLNLGYLDTEFKDLGQAALGLIPAVKPGDPIAQAPEFTVNFGAQYEVPFNGGAALTPRLDYTYTDDYTLTQRADYWRIQRGFGLLNARITYDSGADWTLSLLGTNLTDEFYLNSGQYAAPIHVYFTSIGRPREWGLTFNLNFN